MGSHQKLNYIHVFRALAIFIIVAGHCVAGTGPVSRPLLQSIVQDGTVLFVFISGFLFQYLSDGFAYKPYLKKKFFNIICPYLFTSIPGIAFLLLVPRLDPFDGVNKVLQIPMFLTTGWFHNLPTWYIPMTCVFFICAQLLVNLRQRNFIGSKKPLLFCVLPLLLIFSACFPRLPFGVFVLPSFSAWQTYVGTLKMLLFESALFFPVYILGMFLAAYRDKIFLLYKYRGWLWVGLLLSTIISFQCLYEHVFAGRLLISKLFLTLLSLGYLEHYDAKLLGVPKLNHGLGVVADYSFAIFFIHNYLIKVYSAVSRHLFHIKLSVETDVWKWAIYEIVELGCIFLSSLLLAMFLKKLLTWFGIKHTRWFIGV